MAGSRGAAPVRAFAAPCCASLPKSDTRALTHHDTIRARFPQRIAPRWQLEAWAQSDVALAAQAPHVAAAYDAPAPPADALPSGFARARGRAPAGKRARRAAAGSEQLVALQLDVDAGGARLRDCVLWDARERHTSPEAFAALLVRDLNLPVYFTVRARGCGALAAAG